MNAWKRFLSAVGAPRLIVLLGAIEIAVAVIRIIGASGNQLAGAVGTNLLIILPGIILAYGGYRLPDSDIRRETYPGIVAWTFGGALVMLIIMGLLHVSPVGGGIDRPLFAVPFGMALGSVGGFGIGVNQARASSKIHEAEEARQEAERARQEAEQHSQELQQTKAELEETVEHLRTSNKRLEDFAYAASHDLQEPLRMVSSYLRLLENRYADDLDGDAQEFIEFAVGGADRMRGMIDSLLEYSRVTTRGNQMERTDANAVLDDVLTDLQIRIEETDATITTNDLPTVTADSDHLAQIFRNLLSNALEYSGEEPPQVHVSAEPTEGEWVFAVADEGIGIDPEYHDRIFKVFEQLHGDGGETGTAGIGLALCERIVERHGGDIWVDSNRGEGTTFYFTIPVANEQQPEPHTEAPSSEYHRS